MSIASDVIRGHIDTIILASLYNCDSYGYEINKSILEKTENAYEIKDATLYSAFRRLEGNDCIVSYWGGEETGARRRYYSITDKGKSLYSKNISEWRASKQIIDALVTLNSNGNGGLHN